MLDNQMVGLMAQLRAEMLAASLAEMMEEVKEAKWADSREH
jgi:hypothetical protein